MSRLGSALLTLGLVVLAACAKSSGESCELNSDCLGGYCRDGECTQDCVDSEKDCPKGYVCNSIGQCEYGGGPGGGGVGGAGNGGAGSGASGTGGDGGDPTTSTGTSTSTGTTTGSGGGGPGAALLTPCNFDSDCDSGMCRPTMVNGEKRCTEACSSLSDCGAGLRCETIGSESYCALSDVGRDCTGVGQCNFACLSPLNYCTSQCASGADCPNGYGCMGVGTPATNVCVRVAADCAANADQCVAPAACDSSPNLVVSSCTIACNGPQDCPQRAAGLPAWSCDGLCRRPGDVYGPLPVGYSPTQYACNLSSMVVNVCNDGLQIDFDTFTQPPPPAVSCSSPTTTDGAPGDSCLDSCRFRGGCDYGFGCVALATLDNVQSIGLCMPRGLGQVGASCTKHGDCAFALCDNGVCSRDCSKDGLCPDGSTCTPTGDLPVEGSMNRHCL